MQQIHLNVKRCSGRGVRVRELSPAELDSIMLNAAKGLDASSTVIELRQTAMRDGINRMIVEYTKDSNLTELGGAVWLKADPAKLEDEYKVLFTAKDDKILSAVYRDYHEVDQKEIDDIMGKALPVAD